MSGNAKLLYAAEYANQRDFGTNPRTYSLDYLAFEPGVSVGVVTTKIGWEKLEGKFHRTVII